MKVKCIQDIDGGGFIEIGSEYTVYAMMIWKNSLSYFLSEGPHFYVAEQFEIVDRLLPLVWYFSFETEKKDLGLQAIWGYKEMVFDDNHYVDLIEEEKEALDIFALRRQEIDDYEALRASKLSDTDKGIFR